MEYVQQKQTTAAPTSLKKIRKTNPAERQVISNKPIQISPIKKVKPNLKEGIGTKMDKLINILTKEEMEKDTRENKKNWKIPLKWKRTMNKSTKPSPKDKALCFFINKKGELEPPVLLPVYNGNIVIYKYTIHEVDPRDFLTLHQKKRSYKLLIYNITDRKAVSNRNYGVVKANGNSTLDDEVLIKAMLTAKTSQMAKQQIGKGALVIGGLAVAGIIIWFFSRS